ncbi:unnamed protein product [Amoebophrya sp. A25]|nr:unnamed protein product [Amoebophrya sp. A25]|eukprot:GSA25T00004205001.1
MASSRGVSNKNAKSTILAVALTTAATTLHLRCNVALGAKSRAYVVDEEGAFLNADPDFLSKDEVTRLHRLGLDMGFHNAGTSSDEPAGRITILPLEAGKVVSYATAEGDVEFESSDVIFGQEEDSKLMETLLARSTSEGFSKHLGKGWNKTVVPDAELRIRKPLYPPHGREDAHLDMHLAPHVVGTSLFVLKGGSSNEGDEGQEGETHLRREGSGKKQSSYAWLQESGQKKGPFLVFPCVETEEFEPKEWNKRRKICETAYHTMDGAHSKLLERLRYGINHESEHSRLKYMEAHPELGMFHNVFTEEEDSGLRRWNWRWSVSEEGNLNQHMHRDGLYKVVAAMCDQTVKYDEESAGTDEEGEQAGKKIGSASKKDHGRAADKNKDHDHDDLDDLDDDSAEQASVSAAAGKDSEQSTEDEENTKTTAMKATTTVEDPSMAKGLKIPLRAGTAVHFRSQRVLSGKRAPVVERMGWHAICASAPNKLSRRVYNCDCVFDVAGYGANGLAQFVYFKFCRRGIHLSRRSRSFYPVHCLSPLFHFEIHLTQLL